MADKHYQIIICLPDGNAPKVYLINKKDVTKEMKTRMKDEMGEFPAWCTPYDSDDDTSIYDIRTLGIRVDAWGGIFPSEKTITRTYHFIVG